MPCNDTAFACGIIGDAANDCASGNDLFTMGSGPGLEFYTLQAGSQSTTSPSSAPPSITPSTHISAPHSVSISTSPSLCSANTSENAVCGEGSERSVIIGLGIALGVCAVATVVLVLALARIGRRSGRVQRQTKAASDYHSMPELSAVRPPQEIAGTEIRRG